MNEVLVLSNPRGRKKKFHRRRNPIGGSLMNSAIDTVKNGALGAVGGLANDVVYGYAKGFLPAPLQAGYGRTGVKLATAVLLGIATDKVFRGRGKAVAVGAATVTLHEALRDLANQAAPNIPVGAYEDAASLGYDGSAQRVGSYMQQGAYMRAPAAQSMGDLLPP